MSTKFTPGPWQVNDGNPYQVCDCDGEVRGCSLIAFTGGEHSERVANAHLIAAAPDLYEALESILSDYEEAITPAFEGDITQHEATQIALARAALKKARNEY